MYEALYRYVIKYGKVDLPGLGAVALQRQAAASEFVNHSFSPPQYRFHFERSEDVPPEKLFSWIASLFHITEQEAVIRFNEFLYDVNRQLKEGKQIQWPGVGSLQKEFSGEIHFVSELKTTAGLDDVRARKVTRQNAEHTMLVGEREKTSSQMKELLLGGEKDGRDYWWVWPLAAAIALLIFLGWYFSENGSSGASANHHHISPSEAPSGYKLSP
jgi:hypothetical protein